eukprot:Tamp_26385.p1 GENE.Tamp_26385~~Tamp_26385.p1  ORF type:complete len:220 (+),score=5.45 Tamp_26385:83-661(+)
MPAAARVRPPSHPRHLVNCAVVFTSVEAVAFLWAGFPGAEAAGDCYSGWRGLTNKYEGLQLWVWFACCFVAGGLVYSGLFFFMSLCIKPVRRRRRAASPAPSVSTFGFDQLGGPVARPSSRPSSAVRDEPGGGAGRGAYSSDYVYQDPAWNGAAGARAGETWEFVPITQPVYSMQIPNSYPVQVNPNAAGIA